MASAATHYTTDLEVQTVTVPNLNAGETGEGDIVFYNMAGDSIDSSEGWTIVVKAPQYTKFTSNAVTVGPLGGQLVVDNACSIDAAGTTLTCDPSSLSGSPIAPGNSGKITFSLTADSDAVPGTYSGSVSVLPDNQSTADSNLSNNSRDYNVALGTPAMTPTAAVALLGASVLVPAIAVLRRRKSTDHQTRA
ncbi:hypothetical protein [Microbacterium sp. B24]|uniref:hypothetical protein n=1 Tax=Microbacterium sp. B24 TaxID=95616 RepID=UPI0011D24F83|nr:hypothetical protein [Microbacterium sp. B24]